MRKSKKPKRKAGVGLLGKIPSGFDRSVSQGMLWVLMDQLTPEKCSVALDTACAHMASAAVLQGECAAIYDIHVILTLCGEAALLHVPPRRDLARVFLVASGFVQSERCAGVFTPAVKLATLLATRKDDLYSVKLFMSALLHNRSVLIKNRKQRLAELYKTRSPKSIRGLLERLGPQVKSKR